MSNYKYTQKTDPPVGIHFPSQFSNSFNGSDALVDDPYLCKATTSHTPIPIGYLLGASDDPQLYIAPRIFFVNESDDGNLQCEIQWYEGGQHKGRASTIYPSGIAYFDADKSTEEYEVSLKCETYQATLQHIYPTDLTNHIMFITRGNKQKIRFYMKQNGIVIELQQTN